MSSLWTPDGEHRVDHRPETSLAGEPAADDEADDLSPEDEEALAARLDELRNQLVATPAEVVVANHAYGLFELAAIHLSQQPPRIAESRLAIDALGALVEGLQGRLGQAEPSLKDALAQIRLAYVQIGGAVPGEAGTTPPTGGGDQTQG